MSEWGPPQTSETPHQPSNGIDALLGKIESLQHQINEMRSNLLRPAGISVEPDRIRFGGNVAIEGTLSLPAGIIDNDALATPVQYASSGTSESAVSITTAESVHAVGSIPVPAGFTRATVLCFATGSGGNSTAGVDNLYVRATINGVSGGSVPWRADPGSLASGAATAIRTLTDLSGGEIAVGTTLRSQTGSWGTAPFHIAHTDAIVLFAR